MIKELIWNAADTASIGASAGVVMTTTPRYMTTVRIPTRIPFGSGFNSSPNRVMYQDEMPPIQTKIPD